MGHNSWKAKVRRIEASQRDETDRELHADAVALVDKWNADLETRRTKAQYGRTDLNRLPQFSPNIGAAVRAGKPVLRLVCPACRVQGEVDLRKVVRPRDFPIVSIYDALVCASGRCRGDSPPPEMIGLFPGSPEVKDVMRELRWNTRDVEK